MASNFQSTTVKFKVIINKIDFRSLLKSQFVTILLKIGKRETKLEGKISDLHFSDKILELYTHIYSDKNSNKFQKRVAEIEVRTGEDTNEAFYGGIKIDIGDFANNRIGEYTDDFKLEKCPCHSSTLNLQLFFEMLDNEELSASNINFNSINDRKSARNLTLSQINNSNEFASSPKEMRTVAGRRKLDRSPSFCARQSGFPLEESTKDFNSKNANALHWSFEEDKNNNFSSNSELEVNCKAAHKKEADASKHLKSYKIQVQDDKTMKILHKPENKTSPKRDPKSDFIKSNIEKVGRISELKRSPRVEKDKIMLQSRNTLKGIVLRENRVKTEKSEGEYKQLKSFENKSKEVKNRNQGNKSSNQLLDASLEDIFDTSNNEKGKKSQNKQKLLEMLISKVTNIEKSVNTMKESKSQSNLISPKISRQEVELDEIEILRRENLEYKRFTSEIAIILGCKDHKDFILQEITKIKKAQTFDSIIKGRGGNV